MQFLRVLVVIPHEFFRGKQVGTGLVTKLASHRGLEVKRKMFRLAARREMRGVTDAPKKICGARRPFSFGCSNQSASAQFFQRPASVSGVTGPQRAVEIAQAAGALLDVRLLEAYCPAKLPVPRVAFVFNCRNESAGAFAPFFFQRLQKRVVVQLTTRQQSRTNQRGLQMRIIAGCRYTVTHASEAV